MKIFIILALAVATVSAASLNTIAKYGFPEGRIINGEDAAKGEAPYIISLQFLLQHICGGSLISENWILTAAHCMNVVEPIVAVAGINKLSGGLFGQTRFVTDQIRHESYGGGVGPYDIGLAYVNIGFNLNTWVAVISLPLNEVHDYVDCRVYGFGVKDDTNKVSNKLQGLKVDPIPYKECKEYYPDPPLAETNICTRNPGTTDSACSGDSGGPLVCRIDDVDTLVGIVSWGTIPCGYNSAPSVYTRVSAYIDWINGKI